MAKRLFVGSRTIYNIKLMNSLLFNYPYKPLPNTTLNEKFDILIDYKPNRSPYINLLTIGNGVKQDVYKDNNLILQTTPHDSTDAALFNHLPFYLRLKEDVSYYPPNPNLRLRKELLINGKVYVAYYGYFLKDIDYQDEILVFSKPEDEFVNVSKLSTYKDDYLNLESALDTNLKNFTVDYVGDYVRYYVYFNKSDVDEMLNAMDILGYDSKVITEMGVCSSVPIKHNDYNEVVWTQINFFLSCNYDIEKIIRDDKKFDFYIEVAGSEFLRTKIRNEDD